MTNSGEPVLRDWEIVAIVAPECNGRGEQWGEAWKALTQERGRSSRNRKRPHCSEEPQLSGLPDPQPTACSARQTMVVPRGHASPWQRAQDPRQALLPGKHGQTNWNGRDLLHLGPMGPSSLLASYLHLPLEASGEARLVRKVGRGQDAMKERMLEMGGPPPLSIIKKRQLR